ncbi:MAG: DNA polymerase III subunit chi [Chlamydiae bacterium]|nr:DNA polymerase III subunit chi [Chlamydiota bacterium]
MTTKPTVTYFTVKHPDEKLKILSVTAQNHIQLKKQLHILSADKTSLSFVSQLLWKYPPSGFIVHNVKGQQEDKTLVELLLPEESYSFSESIFNLTAQPITSELHLKQIYEFEDLSHPNKKIIFEKKFKLYQDLGFTLRSN